MVPRDRSLHVSGLGSPIPVAPGHPPPGGSEKQQGSREGRRRHALPLPALRESGAHSPGSSTLQTLLGDRKDGWCEGVVSPSLSSLCDLIFSG